jgi:ribonuclease HI
MAKKKFYVVWEGRQPGVYLTWDDCQEQVLQYPGAKYKAFDSQQEAVMAFRGSGEEEELLLTRIAVKNMEATEATPKNDYANIPEINPNAIAVDGACAGNPGMMEYRGVRVATGEEIFHVGPLADGTNNVAEYLALIHALALLFRQNDTTTPIYTDSATAVSWVRNRGCRTKLTPTEGNKRIFEMLARANIWVRSHPIVNPILRWNTPLWGEIPADFGRK